MLYVLWGTDESGARKKFEELIKRLLDKKPDSNVYRFNSISWDEARFEELLWSRGIFEENFVVALNVLSEREEAFGFILDHVDEIKNSPSIFILLERKLLKEHLKLLDKYAQKVQEFPAK